MKSKRNFVRFDFIKNTKCLHFNSQIILQTEFFIHDQISRVRPKISHLRDAAPLLELDRDERKLEAFLQLHKHDLLVADLRIFLPFTINLDPYLRKVLKGTISFAEARRSSH